MNHIVLASASPRRKELLEQLGLTFSILPSTAKEVITKSNPAEAVVELAASKALDIAAQISDNSLILGADTIVTYQNQIMGKPSDEEQAFDMLSRLSGKTHIVYTGVAAVRNGVLWKTFAENTEVTFYPMSEEEIRDYISTKDPMDKAGAYGIQGICAKYIKSIHGDYNNVVGLPIGRLYQEILKPWLIETNVV